MQLNKTVKFIQSFSRIEIFGIQWKVEKYTTDIVSRRVYLLHKYVCE